MYHIFGFDFIIITSDNSELLRKNDYFWSDEHNWKLAYYRTDTYKIVKLQSGNTKKWCAVYSQRGTLHLIC